jgi:hypothetical protein
LESEARAGRTPDVLLDRPVLRADLSHIWQGFWQIHAARGNNGYGPLPITTGEVLAWLDLHGYAQLGDRAEMLRLFREMDSAYMEATQSDGDSVPRSERR